MTRVVAALGGAIATIGSQLDWTGVEYSSTLDRRLALVSGIAAIGVAVAAAWRPRLLLALVLPGAVALNMGVVNYLDVSRHKYEYTAYPDARVGVGIYAVLAGSQLVLAAAAWMLLGAFRERHRRVEADAGTA